MFLSFREIQFVNLLSFPLIVPCISHLMDQAFFFFNFIWNEFVNDIFVMLAYSFVKNMFLLSHHHFIC